MYAENTYAYKPRIAWMRRSKTSATHVNARHKNKTYTTHPNLSEVHRGSSNPPSREQQRDEVEVVQGNIDVYRALFNDRSILS
jgi:hypothetical protein